MADKTSVDQFVKAAELGDIDTLAQYAAEGGNVNAATSTGRTALIMAGAYPKVVDFLIKQGADPKAVDNVGMTPLHYAAYFYCIAPNRFGGKRLWFVLVMDDISVHAFKTFAGPLPKCG